jgi:hypothetical protein
MSPTIIVPTQALLHGAEGLLNPVTKRWDFETDQSPTSGDEVHNEWIYTLTSLPYIFIEFTQTILPL